MLSEGGSDEDEDVCQECDDGDNGLCTPDGEDRCIKVFTFF